MAEAATTPIRPLAARDYEQWMSLWQGYHGAFYRRVNIPAEVTEAAWTRMLDPAEPMFGALCWNGGSAIGLVHWLIHRSFRTIEDHCYLADLFVVPERRGKGLGRLLIEHVYAAAKAAGCCRVWWLTHETNQVAMRLYGSLADYTGFVHYRKQLD